MRRWSYIFIILGCAGSQHPECMSESSLGDVAAEAWIEAGVPSERVPCITQITFLDETALGEVCRPLPNYPIASCSNLPTDAIYIRTGLNDATVRAVMVHELGHLIAQTPYHLVCLDTPGDDVMCPNVGAQTPTERDVKFVLNLK